MKRPLLVLVAASALLAGCSSGSKADGPVALPLVSESPAPSAMATAPSAAVSSSAEPASEVPVAARAMTREGAEAFTKYFWAEFDSAYRTLDSETVERITDRACLSCQGFVDDLRRTRAAGGSYEGGATYVQEAACAPLQGELASVLLTYDAAAAVLVDGEGNRKTVESEQHKAQVSMTLLWDDDGWRVREIART